MAPLSFGASLASGFQSEIRASYVVVIPVLATGGATGHDGTHVRRKSQIIDVRYGEINPGILILVGLFRE